MRNKNGCDGPCASGGKGRCGMKCMLMGMLLVCAVLWSSVSFAMDSEPLDVLQTTVDEVLVILNSPEFEGGENQEQRDELLYQKAKDLFDFRAFSMGALGHNWRRFSADQQTEFVSFFSRLIAETYMARIQGESLKDLSIEYVDVEMLAPTKSGRQRADVFSEVSHEGVITPVDYRMLKPAGGVWKIYDVKIEGVSLLGNYRQQYQERFMDTPDTLIREVKEKVNKK